MAKNDFEAAVNLIANGEVVKNLLSSCSASWYDLIIWSTAVMVISESVASMPFSLTNTLMLLGDPKLNASVEGIITGFGSTVKYSAMTITKGTSRCRCLLRYTVSFRIISFSQDEIENASGRFPTRGGFAGVYVLTTP